MSTSFVGMKNFVFYKSVVIRIPNTVSEIDSQVKKMRRKRVEQNNLKSDYNKETVREKCFVKSFKVNFLN